MSEATTLIPDDRVHHYWDPERRVGDLFAATAGTSEPAWDVWLLFDREARWSAGEPPELSWWAHQLGGLPPDRRLDPERFTDKAIRLE